MVGAVEDAIALATRKYYKTQENMRAELDKESGEIRAYVVRRRWSRSAGADGRPGEPDHAGRGARPCAGSRSGRRDPLLQATDVLGRIAAQMAKQVIFQKVREAERDTVFNEYNHRVGESAERRR